MFSALFKSTIIDKKEEIGDGPTSEYWQDLLMQINNGSPLSPSLPLAPPSLSPLPFPSLPLPPSPSPSPLPLSPLSPTPLSCANYTYIMYTPHFSSLLFLLTPSHVQ